MSTKKVLLVAGASDGEDLPPGMRGRVVLK
jgi:hypothetical protein